ncbi:MAG: TfoX/Sxy family protein [Chloroflexi bacterium]|nr:TfoX/Sxy family protein [Chloroflexota bacterium]
MTKLTDVRGIGPTTTEWLNEIGIHTLEDIQALGAVETYKRLKRAFPKFVTLNALWGLEAVLNDMDWRDISPERKAELRKLIED